MEKTALYEVRPLEDFEWPVTYRYHMRAPWGDTQSELTVDVPALKDDIESSTKLGGELWRRAIAAAITRETELVVTDAVIWRFIPSPLPLAEVFSKGLLGGTPATRNRSACLVLHSGHIDRRARQRFALPGIPAEWVTGGLLNRTARGGLERLARAMLMGMCGHLTGGPMVWLLPYPRLLDVSATNPSGVAFRRVEYVRCCWHTRPAPDVTGGPWP